MAEVPLSVSSLSEEQLCCGWQRVKWIFHLSCIVEGLVSGLANLNQVCFQDAQWKPLFDPWCRFDHVRAQDREYRLCGEKRTGFIASDG